MGEQSALPAQAVEDVPQSPEDTTAIDSTNQPPLHTRYAANDVLSTPQRESRSSNQVEKESQEILGRNDMANVIADSTANTSLISTLQAAAHAHEESATSDQKVAEEYRQLIESMGA